MRLAAPGAAGAPRTLRRSCSLTGAEPSEITAHQQTRGGGSECRWTPRVEAQPSQHPHFWRISASVEDGPGGAGAHQRGFDSTLPTPSTLRLWHQAAGGKRKRVSGESQGYWPAFRPHMRAKKIKNKKKWQQPAAVAPLAGLSYVCVFLDCRQEKFGNEKRRCRNKENRTKKKQARCKRRPRTGEGAEVSWFLCRTLFKTFRV